MYKKFIFLAFVLVFLSPISAVAEGFTLEPDSSGSMQVIPIISQSDTLSDEEDTIIRHAQQEYENELAELQPSLPENDIGHAP
jgi:hypothetical protein